MVMRISGVQAGQVSRRTFLVLNLDIPAMSLPVVSPVETPNQPFGANPVGGDYSELGM
jgi:hypothetical protein